MSLRSYTLKRLLLLIPVLLGISIGVFLLLKLTPGNPVTVILPPNQRTPANIARVRARLGLNDPIYIQYGKWLFHSIQGDLGRSYRTSQPVTTMIASRLWPTIQLSVVAFIVGVSISIPLGIVSAVFKNTWVDESGRVVAFLGVSVPSFWLGVMAILVFSLFWKQWFGSVLIPPGGYAPPSEGLWQWFRHVIAPGLTLGVGYTALKTRLTRSTMVEVLNEGYVQTARAKGVRERMVVGIHAFRNALIPIVTVLGLDIAYLLNGAVVVEQVFQWPGIGRLLYQAVISQDMPLIQGIILFVGTTYVVANLVVDIAYTFLDPRIQYD